jgi:hypothetical protein
LINPRPIGPRPTGSRLVSPRSCTSSRAGVGGVGWDPSPLEPFANARLLLNENARPGDITSLVIATHVIECLLERAQYITAKLNTTGVETGDFTYNGHITRTAKLSATPGFSWLSSELIWQQNGRRVASVSAARSAVGSVTPGSVTPYPIAQAISTVVAPCNGLIWLGDLSLLNPAGNPDVDPYAQYTKFAVLEFGASYGSGGIGSLVQPLIGERIFGTLTPNWQG